MVKNLPASAGVEETKVLSLAWEDPWRRKWQPTPVFLPGDSHVQRSLAGYSPWGRSESDTSEAKELHTHASHTHASGSDSHSRAQLWL